MLKIGITGGIGTGKTTVCKIFETLGIPVFYADEESKKILFHDSDVNEELRTIFGKEIFTEGIPDRKKIADIVFSDREKLEQLNAILHPAVIRKSEEWFHEPKRAPYAIKEAALIFEVGGERNLDKVIVISSPEEISIGRIMKRDNVSEEEVRLRMGNQLAQEVKEKKADFLIVNDDRQMLSPQVMNIHKHLLQLTQSPGS